MQRVKRETKNDILKWSICFLVFCPLYLSNPTNWIAAVPTTPSRNVCQSYAAHLRLAAAVFYIERGWNGVHATTRAYFAAHQVQEYGLPSTMDLEVKIVGGERADLQALAMLGGVLDISILHLHPGSDNAKGLEDVELWTEVGNCNLDDFATAEVKVRQVTGDGSGHRGDSCIVLRN